MTSRARKKCTLFGAVSSILCLLLQWQCQSCYAAVNTHNVVRKIVNTALLEDNPLLLVSTLGGSLIAIEQDTGDIRWEISNDPAVMVPFDMEINFASKEHLFLPDPKDGSLYLLANGKGGYESALKKLSYTIPELVASSPCRSTDGILYTGKKVASWMAVDAVTGKKHLVMGNEQQNFDVCPADGSQTIFIGRTEYSIAMYDSHKKEKRWNVSYFDYTAGTLDDIATQNYPLVHFATNSDGSVMTLDRDSGRKLWGQKFKSPVIAMYAVQDDSLVMIPFTTVGVDTLKALQLSHAGANMKLIPALYVGQFPHGLYALPSLIDNTVTRTLTSPPAMLLIEGPKENKSTEESDEKGAKPSIGSTSNTNPFENLLGHYQIPERSTNVLQITGKSDVLLKTPENLVIETAERVTIDTEGDQVNVRVVDELKLAWSNFTKGNISMDSVVKISMAITSSTYHFVQTKAVMTLLFLLLVFITFYMAFSLYGKQSHLADYEQDDSVVRVGKIELYPSQILGKGCEGTFVFNGKFDGRPVAVKRLLPDCFSVADREVDLLRESDEHPNVIRYFCTEKDRQFRYIALELCAATLEDFVIGKFRNDNISEVDILLQATSGLAHLHSLDIVHRDIKPHNVLLSYPNAKGEIKAMISDFGLCKKLMNGRYSFSHHSGAAGTDGWIAPEMIDPEKTATFSVDIFSLGCLFYFVLSKGKHPFGDDLHRQANIINGEGRLEHLEENKDYVALNLILAMIDIDPKNRPTASAAMKHPFFWDADKRLAFLLEVSDRVESENLESEVLKALESKNWVVVQRDWRKHIGEAIAADLRKYRNYRGENVRDLLRALRNKKHHYQDLAEDAKEILKNDSKDFLAYFTKRFPLLLIHTWVAMVCIREEPGKQKYYDTSYLFPQNVAILAKPGEKPEVVEDEIEQKTNSPKDWTSAWNNDKKQNKRRTPPHPAWKLNWRETPKKTPLTEEGENNRENMRTDIL
ncbi:serine/threonine-protein kinase/endoribonuclease ire-1 isoform X2 [Cloeon dipterum]|uniref:serine/threonine-protein kinase/endoribonuclease ire-1 isoform X2 n=1 Tax=Cloeon dipterum TaxID=197152 RepID=UPI00321FCEA1